MAKEIVSDFDNFVNRQKEIVEAEKINEIDWEKVKEQWISRIDDLYNKFENYLSKWINENSVYIEYEQIPMFEEKLGSYTVKQLSITIGKHKILFKPIGTLLIGAYGRIDIEGPFGSARIVLVDAKAKSFSDLLNIRVIINGAPEENELPKKQTKEPMLEWKIVGKPPSNYLSVLDKESFITLIMEVTNG